MAKLFCPECQNLLIDITTSDSFILTCPNCHIQVQPDEKASLRYEDVSGTNLVVFRSLLQNAGKDPLNPKVYKKCKCGSTLARQVRLGDEMRLINTCIKCNEQWLDGTKETDEDGDPDLEQTIDFKERKK